MARGMKMVENSAKLRDYVGLIMPKGSFMSKRRLNNYLRYIFDGIKLEGRTMLDVGGGSGLYSFFAAYIGAKYVVCLEPGLEGSSKRELNKFREISGVLSLNNVNLERIPIQNYNPKGLTFDIILLHNSINHLDEEACIYLLKEDNAKDRYREIFNKLSKLSNPQAKLVIADCSRYNFFSRLPVRNPFAKTIEWHKHQSPECWSAMLQEAGFTNPRIRWTPVSIFGMSPIGRLGRWLTSRYYVSFFLLSHFTLIMVKTGCY